MTAVPNWDIVGPSGTDAELALASAAGDRDAFAGIYDRYADRLHDFCRRNAARSRGRRGLRAGRVLHRRDAADAAA